MKKIVFLLLVYLIVISTTNTLKAKELVSTKRGEYNWEPINIDGGGSVNFIIIHQESPNVVYAGIDVGGIYKSIDYGENWIPCNIIYAACGGQGIFKTTDGGFTWVERNKGLEELIPSKFKLSNIKYISLAIDPKNSELIYAGSGERRGQIYKSVDGGESWAKLTGNKKNIHPNGWWIKETNQPGDVGYSANCVSIDPSNNNRIYVAGKSGVWRSDDGGITWHAKVKGLEATC